MSPQIVTFTAVYQRYLSFVNFVAVTFSVRPFQATSVPEPATLTSAVRGLRPAVLQVAAPAGRIAPPVARESGTC